jgi:acetylornithine deacetylase/succinyl-diaminopimelate desuccinylase-like protein
VIQAGIEAAIDLLARLVAARSPNPPGDERLVADVIIGAAEALALPKGTVHAADPARPNLIFHIGHGSPNLLLAAHMDTMPPGGESLWRSDPYTLRREGERLIGLGSADMKAAIVTMLFAAARIVAIPEPRGSLTLVFSSDEEAGSAYGMEWLAGQGLLDADAAIVCEPSSVGAQSWERLFVAQRGSCVSWLVAGGEPGHSGMPVPREQRASASFVRALSALLDVDPFPEWSHPVDGTRPLVNVATMVCGGMVPFAHPESLRASIEVRTIEGMTKDLVLARLHKILGGAGLADCVSLVPAAGSQNWIPPGKTVHEDLLLSAACRAWRQVLCVEPVQGVYPAGTDSSHLDALGIPALPAFGPGSLAVAHKPNESIHADDLPRAVELFEAAIRHYHRSAV